MSKQRIFLLATGSFNPPTIMHLRIMELARDHLHKLGFSVVGGAISPVHDGYGKKELQPAKHRVKMLQLALQNNDWVKVSSWESLKNDNWKRTRLVLDHHQNVLNDCLRGKEESYSAEDWLPDSSSRLLVGSDPVKLKIVCGSDYLDSFNVKDLWSEEDMVKLAQDYGFVVITREGNDVMKAIWNSDILNENQRNIHIVHEWIRNEISFTKVRLALRRNESIRYIVSDPVLDYIRTNKLYNVSS